MHAVSRCLALPTLLALAGTAGAQSAPFNLEARIPWGPSLGAPNALNRTVAGDASGDGYLDLFVRGGTGDNRIVYFDSLWSPAGSINTGIACADFDIAPGKGVDGAAALAFVDGTGLWHLKFDRTTGTFLSPVIVADGAAWANAQLVRTGNFDVASALDYAGVKADGHTLVLRANGGPSNVEVDVGSTILDMAFLQWAPGSGHQLAVLTPGGVQLYLGTGGGAGSVPMPGYTSKAMAVLPVPSAVDRLAWIGTTPAGKTAFAVLRRQTPAVENLVELDPTDTSADSLTTGDMDGDGDTDVIVGRSSNRSPWYIPNGAAAVPWFNPTSKMTFAWSSVYSAAGAPVVAPFVNGELPRLVVPTYAPAGGAELAVFAHTANDLSSSDVFLFQPATSYQVQLLTAPDTQQGVPQRDLHFQMNFQGEVLAAPPTGPEDRRLEVTIYDGHPTTNNTTSGMDRRYWIGWPANIATADVTFDGIRFALPDVGSDDCDLVPRFVEVRQIRIGYGTTIVESGPTYTFGVIRNEADMDQYDPLWGPEAADLLHGNPLASFDCISNPGDNAVHASALVRRNKPLPVSDPSPPPVPLPDQTTATATTPP